MQGYQKKYIPLSSVIDSVEHSFRDVELTGFPAFSVRGVTIADALGIAEKHPDVLALFGSVPGEETDTIPSPVELAIRHPKAVFAWLACAAGEPGNGELETQIAKTPDQFYLGMLAASIRQTIGDGSFYDYFLSLMSAFVKEGLIKAKEKTQPTELSGESKEQILPEMFQQAITAAAQSSPTTAS